MNGDGPLTGLRVVELCDETAAFAGKLMADLGAEVIKVEPPEGDHTRAYGPFLEDQQGPERSLWWWQYNSSKRGVTLDLGREGAPGLLRHLLGTADVFLTSEPPARLKSLGIDHSDLSGGMPGLVTVSVRPFGRHGPRADEPATNLTLAANGGFAWMNGYDDHSLPPVQGGGPQAYHTAAHFAVMSALTAILHRDAGGPGQLVDININAALNVTSEAGSYTWLVAQETVQRQTGRHAGVTPSMPSQVRCADGGYVNTGIPPRRGEEFRRLLDWMETLGIREEFPLTPMLELGMQRERIELSRIAEDPVIREIFVAGRGAMDFVASKISAYEYFSGAQDRGFQVGIVYAPEDVFTDPQFVAHGFPVEVEHPELGRTFTYPGAPISFGASPWKIRRRAPLLGEDNDEVWGALVGTEELGRLRTTGLV